MSVAIGSKHISEVPVVLPTRLCSELRLLLGHFTLLVPSSKKKSSLMTRLRVLFGDLLQFCPAILNFQIMFGSLPSTSFYSRSRGSLIESVLQFATSVQIRIDGDALRCTFSFSYFAALEVFFIGLVIISPVVFRVPRTPTKARNPNHTP